MSKQPLNPGGSDSSLTALNLPGAGLRPGAASITRRQISLGGQIFVTSIQPDNSDQIQLRPSPPGMGTLVIRFVGLLVVAVVVLALAWSR